MLTRPIMPMSGTIAVNPLAPVGCVLLAEVARHEAIEDDLLIPAAVGQHLCADQRKAMALQIAGERTAPRGFVGVARRDRAAVGRVIGASTTRRGRGGSCGGAI